MRHGSVLRGDKVHPISDHGGEEREQRERWHGYFLVCDVVVMGVQALEGGSRRQAVEGCVRVAAAPLLFWQGRRGDEGVRRRSGGVMKRGRTARNLARTWGGGRLTVGLG